MSAARSLRKLYWFISALYYAKKYPIDNSYPFFGVTGTDGKTSTSSFLYEVAKTQGYTPLVLTTVSVKFKDHDIPVKLRSTSFFAYSIKESIDGLKSFNLKKFFKNILFLDSKGFDALEEEHRTTPLSSEIRKLINEYKQKGADLFILETTSHAIDQYRVYGITFDAIAYTNITREHLDYHGTWEAYAQTKASFMKQLKPGGLVTLNVDDDSYRFLKSYCQQAHVPYYCYGTNKNLSLSPELFSVEITKQQEGNCKYQVTAVENKLTNQLSASLDLFGLYNIYNSLAAFTCFYSFLNQSSNEVSDEIAQQCLDGLKHVQSIKGRMNFISQSPVTIVDFAHTPNAMLNALQSARKLVEQKGNNAKLWVVFGCPGLRDTYKRPAMGKIAFENADCIMITADDPRIEKLSDINDQIISGFRSIAPQYPVASYSKDLKFASPQKGKPFIVRFDQESIEARRNAIAFALNNAANDDVVIMLGKGHETSIPFGTIEYPWSDIEVTKELLSSRKRS